MGEHTREINLCAARIARRGGRRVLDADAAAVRRRLDRAERDAAVERRPGALRRHLRRARRGLPRAGGGAGRGRRRPAADRDAAGHPRDAGGHRRRPARRSASSAGAVPIQAQVALDATGRMLLGTDVGARARDPAGMRADVIGLNCSIGPEHMREPVRYLCRARARPVSVIPNAGLPRNVDGVRRLSARRPTTWPRAARSSSREFGAPVVGGCCGTHARAHRGAARRRVAGAAPRAAARSCSSASLASAITAVGARAAAQAAADRRARQHAGQPRVQAGAAGRRLRRRGRDRARPGRGRRARARRVRGADRARRRGRADAHAREAPGDGRRDAARDRLDRRRRDRARRSRPTPAARSINSINMENGRERIDAVVPARRPRTARPCVALTIDEEGMAKTAERKLAVARRIHDICVGEFGMAPGDADLRRADLHARDRPGGVPPKRGRDDRGHPRAIKRELPGVLDRARRLERLVRAHAAARAVLNSRLPAPRVDAGLDAAIVNPAHVRPIYEISAAGARAGRRPDLRPPPGRARSAHRPLRGADRDEAAPQDDPFAGLTHRRAHPREDPAPQAGGHRGRHRPGARRARRPRQRPRRRRAQRRAAAGDEGRRRPLRRGRADPAVRAAVGRGDEAVGGASGALPRPARGPDQGRRWCSRRCSATCTTSARTWSARSSRTTATGRRPGQAGAAERDHREAPSRCSADADRALGAAGVDVAADAALRCRSSTMRGLRVPGAGRRRGHQPRVRRAGSRSSTTARLYEPGVFYCKDAFEGLGVMDRLSDAERRGGVIAERREQARAPSADTPEPAPAAERGAGAHRPRTTLRRASTCPSRRSWACGGRRRDRPGGGVRADGRAVALQALVGRQGRARRGVGAAAAPTTSARGARGCRPRRSTQGWIVPRAAYGFFPAVADGDDAVVLDADGRRARPVRVPAAGPATTGCASPTTCAPAGGAPDVIALQIVTAGAEATEHIDALQAAGEYSEAYFAHGLAVEAAEGLAEYVHRRILAELGLEPGRGRRYSWGYPACPDLEQHELVLRLLPAGRRPRHRALRRLPVHPRADDRRDRDPPSPGGLLLAPAAASAPAASNPPNGVRPLLAGRGERSASVEWWMPSCVAIRRSE